MSKDSLRYVSMECMALVGGPKRSNHWSMVFKAFLRLDIQSLKVKSLLNPEVEKPYESDWVSLIKFSRDEEELVDATDACGTLELVRVGKDDSDEDEAFWFFDLTWPC